MRAFLKLPFGSKALERHTSLSVAQVEEAAMDGPISPPPVAGSAGNDLPAYMSNGVVGLKFATIH